MQVPCKHGWTNPPMTNTPGPHSPRQKSMRISTSHTSPLLTELILESMYPTMFLWPDRSRCKTDKFTPWTSHAERAALSSGSSTQHKLLSLGINRPAELVGVSDMKIIYPKPVPRVVNPQNEDFIFPSPPGSCSIQYLGIQLQKWHLPCLPCSKQD